MNEERFLIHLMQLASDPEDYKQPFTYLKSLISKRMRTIHNVGIDWKGQRMTMKDYFQNAK